ncbi:hypothetical protein [Flindersiella endophytica]
MSPKSRGRKNDRRPSDRRRQQQRERQRSTLQVPDEVIQTLLGQAAELLELQSPLHAEVFASGVLSAGRTDVPSAQGEQAENALGEALVEAFRGIGSREAAVMLSVFGGLAAPPIALRARTALTELGAVAAGLPAWAGQIGTAKLVEALRADDRLGDGVQLALAFQYADEPPHGISVTIDFTYGGVVTDAWPADSAEELLAGLRAEAEEDDQVTVTPAEPADVAALVGYGYTVADQDEGPRTEDADELRTLVLCRLRDLPAGGVGPPVRRWSRHEREELIDAFLKAPELAEVASAAERESELNLELVEDVTATIVEEGCAADLGRPLRLSPSKLDRLLHALLDVVGQEETQDAVDVVRAWVRFAARRGPAPDDVLQLTLAALDELEEGFRLAVTNPELVEAYEEGLDVITADLDPEELPEQEYEDAVKRRIFALPVPPDAGFDPDDEESFLEMARAEHPTAGEAGREEEFDEAHAGVHAAVARQLWADEPLEVWQTALRLVGLGYERTDVLHALGFAWLRSTQDGGLPYLDALKALPESWTAGNG